MLIVQKWTWISWYLYWLFIYCFTSNYRQPYSCNACQGDVKWRSKSLPDFSWSPSTCFGPLQGEGYSTSSPPSPVFGQSFFTELKSNFGGFQKTKIICTYLKRLIYLTFFLIKRQVYHHCSLAVRFYLSMPFHFSPYMHPALSPLQLSPSKQ